MTTIKSNVDSTLIRTLPLPLKPVAGYIKIHEASGSLAHLRFAQDTITNWVPKAVMARSLADFTDMSFLEIAENILVYFGPALFADKIFKGLYTKNLSPKLKEMINLKTKELIVTKNPNNKVLLPIKAAIAVSTLAIPLCEYSLNYVKNLLTLKAFKQSDFNNIANLSKEKQENIAQQEKVRKSAKKHITIAGGAFAACLGFSALLLTIGKSSTKLQKLSEAILVPGEKIFKQNIHYTKKGNKELARKAETFNKYFSIDLDVNEKVKHGMKKKVLGISGNRRGQLMACVLIGFLGYLGAAKDRGKQNMLEVLFRYPIVTFYVITGSDLFEKMFRAILKKSSRCKELLEKKKMPTLKQLPRLAAKLAKENGTVKQEEFEKLFKQKAAIIGIPALFGLIVMGFFVAAYSRVFTQYRYNKEQMMKGENNEK